MRKALGAVFLMLIAVVHISCIPKPDADLETTGADVDDTTGHKTMEISIFYPEENSELMKDYSNNQTIKGLEQDYNVTFSFCHGTWGEESVDVDKMFSSGTYCDLMYMSHGLCYKGGDGAAVKDGVYRDLTDIVKTSMPNYYKLIQSNEILRKAAYNDDGRIVGLLIIPYDVMEQKVDSPVSVGGMVIRKDWLDRAGLDIPVTYKDWETVLTVFRQDYGCTQPLYIAGGGYTELSPGFSSGLGAIPTMQMNGDTVEYGPATQGWKAYVTLMHRWYEKGLIGSEYVLNDRYGIDLNACISEKSGAMLCPYHQVEEMEEAISGKADFCAVQYPVLKPGQTAQAKDLTSVLGERKIYVTTAVSDEDLLRVLSLLDDLYDPEVAMELTYGQEGDTYIKSDGKFQFTDKLCDNEEGYSFLDAVERYLLPTNLMTLKDVRREMLALSDESREMCDTWNKDGQSLYVPPVTLTQEEQEIYDDIMTDVKAYVQTMTDRMIVGAVDIETEWDDYLLDLYDMGLEDAVKCYQDAYHRYSHR